MRSAINANKELLASLVHISVFLNIITIHGSKSKLLRDIKGKCTIL